MTRIDANRWYYSPDHDQLCQVIEAQTVWGETTCRVWLPGRDSVVRIPASMLKPLASRRERPREDPKLLMWYDQAITRAGEGV